MASVEASRRSRRKKEELELFAASLVHDLRQPLCALRGSVDILRDFYRQDLPEEGGRFVDTAVELGDRLNRMIDDVLLYARSEQEFAVSEEADLTECFAQALANLAPLLGEAGALIEVGGLPRVLAASTQIVRVFQNLIENALVHNGGTHPVVKIGAQREGKFWAVSVADNGPGIPAASRAKVFEPFVRLNAQKARRGAGLGLANVKRIIEGHGGRIWIEDGPQGGAVFRFTLAAVTADVGEAEVAPARLLA